MCERKVTTKPGGIRSFLALFLLPFFVQAQNIELTWSPDQASNISFFRIYKSIENNANYTLLNTVNFPDSAYLDSDVNFDSKYFYSVTSVDETGNESDVSNVVTVEMPKVYSLSVSVNQEQGGAVTTDPEKSEYQEGEQVTLIASANAGYLFDYWSGDVSGNDSVLTITMNSNKTVIANVTSNFLSITGSINYVNSELPLYNTNVKLSGEFSDSLSADEKGIYEFNSLESGANYSIAPERSVGDYETSILSYDAALAARIALQIETNPTEISKIAADVNGDGLVQMYDASLIAMKAIGLENQPDSRVGEWGFYPALRSYDQLTTEISDQNFTATIRGDVDGNWQPGGPLLKNNETKNVYSFLEDIHAQPGDLISIPFVTSGDKDILSFDISLNYDNSSLKYVGLKKTDLINDFQIFENVSNNGSIKVGAFSLNEKTLSGCFLEMVFEVVGETGSSSQVDIESYRLNADPDFYATAAVVIDTDNLASLPNDYELHNNYPNPFNPETNIQFDIPESGNVLLKIYNTLGQEVKTLVEEKKNAGTHKVQWDGRNETGQVVPSGLYIYRLVAENFSATKKMSLMK
ncbi:T9SS type A sorting domain-containing protein [candidate division KSB1 bacterium]|nr:T9SS type A sorting domain-containing protein [candidate division KSB1 bacterium]MBL7093221.1 T9SS type A sorting domain-containing protein [candidate division KSB1 bacterium]